jgi:AFG3 family protein
LTPGFSGADI